MIKTIFLSVLWLGMAIFLFGLAATMPQLALETFLVLFLAFACLICSMAHAVGQWVMYGQ